MLFLKKKYGTDRQKFPGSLNYVLPSEEKPFYDKTK